MAAPELLADAARIERLRARLLAWYGLNKRQLPWREVGDPYQVWISEIMLQQTRVEQMRGYFERFVAAFPTLEALAEAPEEAVLKAWEGLGYYARARNLQAAARKVVAEFDGQLPGPWRSCWNCRGSDPTPPPRSAASPSTATTRCSTATSPASSAGCCSSKKTPAGRR